MTRQPLVARRAEELLGVAVAATAPVAGGDVATTTRLRMADGTLAVIKTRAHTPPGFFEAEAAGLRWLAEVEDGVEVATLLAAAPDCVVLRWVEPGRPNADAAARFGARLAHTHAAGAPAHGSAPFAEQRDGFIATLPLPHRPADSWAEFYATQRVLPYLRLAHDRGAVDDAGVAAVEAMVGRLPTLVPDEPASRLHGDLWNGNVLWSQDHRGLLIDPAAHGGHRETDLAMLALFGLPHLARALAAYEEVRPLAPGFEDRLGVHQVFPLLVHAVLFGGGYGVRAAEAAARYS